MPEKKSKLNRAAMGRSGTLISSGVVDDDHISRLSGVEGQIVFAKMARSDSQVRKIIHAVLNPIKSGKWSIEPASEEPQDLEVAKLCEHIIFHDINFTEKLDEYLDFIFKGFVCLEKVHKNFITDREAPLNQYTGYDTLAYRDQRTLDEFVYDNGKLKTIHQVQSGDLDVDVYLPVENLILIYNEKKGDDNGYAWMRMLYGPYDRKLLYKQLQAIGIERSSLPVPVCKLPDGIPLDSDEYTIVQTQLEAFTSGEKAYFIVPYGYDLDLKTGGSFNPANTQIAIKAENEEMSGAVVGMFLEMGIGGNSGNQAGTEISAKFFSKGLLFLANKICNVFNRDIIPEIVKLNITKKLTALPKLTVSGISDDAGKELMEIVTGYTNAKVINPDEQLEDHIRKAHGLPKKAEGTQIDNGAPEDDPNAPEEIEPSEVSPEETPEPIEPEPIEPEVELSEKKVKTPSDLITSQGARITDNVKMSLELMADRFIGDVMNKYKMLPTGKKQQATSNIELVGIKKFKESLKIALTDTATKAVKQARKEVPNKADIKLTLKNEKALAALGDISEIKLNEFSKLPAHIQVLIARQVDLITKSSTDELKNKISFVFSSSETSTQDARVIRQDLENAVDNHLDASNMIAKGLNASATITNESRNAFFFEPEVLEEIHSFTFMNVAPKSDICTELTGLTFAANDVESMRYSPPLHHNCKSFLRANLKTSKGIDKLEITTLNPTAQAEKSITLHEGKVCVHL